MCVLIFDKGVVNDKSTQYSIIFFFHLLNSTQEGNQKYEFLKKLLENTSFIITSYIHFQ